MFNSELFRDKKILVGITGGIAAYKITELVRHLVTAGSQVRVVMTESAKQFITPLTMETLSGHPVLTEMFPEQEFSGTHHIHWADWADAVIIAPATYNVIGKIAGGIADDLLTTMLAAVQCPVVIAPAMNVHMWNNPVFQKNLTYLQELDYLICPPEEGFLAEGYSGKGRLAPLHHLLQYIYKALHPARESLKGREVVITAGRTEEALDPVRYLSNRSTGKMGYALALEAFARSAAVKLVHGPGDIPDPAEMDTVLVRSAEEMFRTVQKYFTRADYYIGAAAVADYAPAEIARNKLKKSGADLNLTLSRTPDILQYTGKRKSAEQVLVGFAVETESPEKNAREKMENKNLDLIVLNNPLEAGAGFGTDTNKVTLFHRDGRSLELTVKPKLDVAREIFEFLLKK